jgi:hypothetical protein
MDTSEVFKEMCEKANLDWIPKFGDYVYCKSTNETGIVRSVYKDYSNKEWVCFSAENKGKDGGVFEFNAPKDSYIPLWRQDQLQDKVRSKLTYTDAIGAVWKLYNAVGVNRTSPYARLNSLEQIWLVFVMEEKFGKVWDGRDWVEEVKVPRKGGMIDIYGDIK